MYVPLAFRAFQRRSGLAVAALVLLCLTGCISTALIERWRDPSFNGPPLSKVLVVGVQRDAGQRRVWESSMVDALMRQHIAATPSFVLFPDKAPTPDQLSAAAVRQGFDGVMASHFVGASRRVYWVPGDVGFGWHRRYFGYWNDIYGPGFVQSDYRADYQTDVFTVAPRGGKLIWTGLTRSVDLSSTTTTTDQISRVLVPDLLREGILRPN